MDLRRRLVIAAFATASFCLSGFAAPGQTSASVSRTALSNGMQISAGGVVMQVTALRNDVLRVTEWKSETGPPEDSSWAVLPAARASSVRVTPDPAGFRTATLRAEVLPDLRLRVSDLTGTVLQEDAAPVFWRGKRFTVTKQMHDSDHFFGLGDKPGPLDRAGRTFTMWNTDDFGWQESSDPIYKSIPFFIEFRQGRAMGVLLDNTWRTSFDFGQMVRDEYSFGGPDGPLTYYLMYGPEPKRVVESYAWLTGPTPLPPMWSLGFQQSRYSYEPESRLIEVAKRLRTDHIPADAVYLDIDFQEKNRPFTVDGVKFPNFGEMVKELGKENLHLIVITDLHIAKLPNAGYVPYDTGTAGDHFVKMPDGSTYSGVVWPGPSVFPDFTRGASRRWWGTLYKEFVAEGVAGFWNDMNEPAVFGVTSKTMPDAVQHRIEEPGFKTRTAGHPEIHNVYGMENSRGTYEGLLMLQPNVRPFVLTRASYAGGQRYAATWTGDNSSTWNHLRMTTPQIENLGLSGFAMSGADVGGFAGSPSPDLLTKWLELAAFQPIDRDHAAKGTRDHEVWVDGPEHEAIRRKFIEERYRLMPYLYTMTEEMSRTGLPIVRPLFLEFPNAMGDGHPMDIDAPGEFLFGDRMLVAPSPSPDEVAPYEVQLPPGGWFDYWTGEKMDRRGVQGARDLEQRDALVKNPPLIVKPELATLPVYVRAGTVLPMAPLTQSTEETPQGSLTLRVYVGAPCGGSLYQDDGKSFDFRKGAFLRMRFMCREDADGSLTVEAAKPEGSFRPWWREIRVEAYGWTPKDRTADSGGKQVSLEVVGRGWATTIPAAGEAFRVTMH